MKCDWNVYGIFDRINALSALRKRYRKRIKEATSESEKKRILKAIDEITSDIDVLRLIIEDEFKIKEDDKKLLVRYSESQQELQPIKFLWDDLKEIPEINKNFKDVYVEEKKHSISKDDMLDITHDFFRDALDKKLYGNFMKNFYRRRDHLRFVPSSTDTGFFGSTYSLTFSKESFISVNRSYTITDLLTLIHEYMHATAIVMNPNHYTVQKNYYSEIDSRFVELVAHNYLKQYLPTYKLDAEKYLTYSDFVCYADYLANMIKLMELEKKNDDFKTNRDLRQFAQSLDIYDEDLDDMLEVSYEDNDFVIGYMYAIEFYKMYEDDKEKSLHTLERFIETDYPSSIKFYKYLKEQGIYPNEHLREYQKEINQAASRLTRKKERN